jgi:hypothetical protein
VQLLRFDDCSNSGIKVQDWRVLVSHRMTLLRGSPGGRVYGHVEVPSCEGLAKAASRGGWWE